MPFRRSTGGRLRGNVLEVESAELACPTDNGRVCLDLVATIGERWARCFERLRTIEDLDAWLAAVGLPADAGSQPHHLEAARTLRAAIFAAVEAAVDGRRLPGWSCDVLNEAVRHRSLAVVDADRTRRFISRDPVKASLAVVASDAIDLVTSDDISRVRECGADDCARVYFDRSPTLNRRWCSMAGCGNRAKIRAHRARSRGPHA